MEGRAFHRRRPRQPLAPEDPRPLQRPCPAFAAPHPPPPSTASSASSAQVADGSRVRFLANYTSELRRAIYEDGVDVRGYFAWSLMDNFEWEMGYSERFGLVFTDFETQQRTPKASAKWFSELAATNTLPSPARFLGDARSREGRGESCPTLLALPEPGDALRRQVAATLAAILSIGSLLLFLTLAVSRRWRNSSYRS